MCRLLGIWGACYDRRVEGFDGSVPWNDSVQEEQVRRTEPSSQVLALQFSNICCVHDVHYIILAWFIFYFILTKWRTTIDIPTDSDNCVVFYILY